MPSLANNQQSLALNYYYFFIHSFKKIIVKQSEPVE